MAALPGVPCCRCAGRVAELPGECHVCGLTLISSPHLARSYHHLFPVPPYVVGVDPTTGPVYRCRVSHWAILWDQSTPKSHRHCAVGDTVSRRRVPTVARNRRDLQVACILLVGGQPHAGFTMVCAQGLQSHATTFGVVLLLLSCCSSISTDASFAFPFCDLCRSSNLRKWKMSIVLLPVCW
jgi:transcription factor Ssl1